MHCLVPGAVVTELKDLTLEVGCGQSRKHSVTQALSSVGLQSRHGGERDR